LEINKSQINKSRRGGCLVKTLLAVGILAGIAIVLVGVAGYLWFSRPAYFHKTAVTADMKQQAAELEARVTTELTADRPYDQPWHLKLTQEQINGWIAARLPDWLANRGAEPHSIGLVRGAMVEIEPDHVEAARELTVEGVTQVVRVAYKAVQEPGVAWMKMKLDGVYGGKLPIPLDRVIEAVRQHYRPADDTAGKLFDEALSHVKSIPLDLPLGDGRDVRVVAVSFADHAADATLVTHFTPRGHKRRQ
jgi:hypothetical protein